MVYLVDPIWFTEYAHYSIVHNRKRSPCHNIVDSDREISRTNAESHSSNGNSLWLPKMVLKFRPIDSSWINWNTLESKENCFQLLQSTSNTHLYTKCLIRQSLSSSTLLTKNVLTKLAADLLFSRTLDYAPGCPRRHLAGEKAKEAKEAKGSLYDRESLSSVLEVRSQNCQEKNSSLLDNYLLMIMKLNA